MSESFDPYLKWFGIPPRERPIHHYRLLAIEVFEADAEVIENAADQRMAHLKRFNTGKHSALAEKLLNEVAAARVCLLNPAKKAKYDEELRQRLAGRDSAVQAAAEMPAAATPPPMSRPAEDSFLTQFETVSSRPRRAVRVSTKKTKTKTPWGMILAVVAALTAVVLIVVLTAPQGGDGGGSPPDRVASAPGKDKLDRHGESGKGADHGLEVAPSPPAAAGPTEVPAVHPRRTEPTTSAASGHGVDEPAGSLMPPEPTKPAEESRAKPEEPSQPDLQVARVGPERPGGEAKQPGKVGLPAPAGPKKISPPDDAARKTAEEKLRDRYRSEIANADSNVEKLRLADRLARDAENMGADWAGRLVMLQQAVGLARDAGDIGKASEILDKIGEVYDINVMSLKVDMVQKRADELLKASGTAKGPRQQQLQQASRELLDVCRGLTTTAIEKGDVETALRCLKIALPAANRLHEAKIRSVIQSSIRDMEKLQKRLGQVQAAMAALRDKPDDSEANLTTGSWYCMVTGDWNTGLPYLSKGSDADLAEAAQKDLAQPNQPAEQAAVGNLWWSLGEKKSGLESVRLKSRATHWYALALPKLSGSVEAKIRKRIEGQGAAGQYALEFDGRSSYVLFHNLVYTGATPITIEAVVKPNHDDGNWGTAVLIGNGNRSGLSLGCEGSQWFFRFDALLNVRGNDRNTMVFGAAGGRPWTHVAAVYDGRGIRLYVDGHRRDNRMINLQHKPGDTPFVLGAWLPSGNKGSVSNGFKGLVRALRISKTALYDDDFVPPQLGNGPATIALFNFTEGRGDRLREASGKKVFGEIHSAQWVKLGDAESRP